MKKFSILKIGAVAAAFIFAGCNFEPVDRDGLIINAAIPVKKSESGDISVLVGKAKQGEKLYIEYSVGDGGSVTFQWYEIASPTDNKEDAQILTGETKNEYVPNLNTPGKKYYFCKITNSSNVANGNGITTAYSRVFTVEVRDVTRASVPVFSLQPEGSINFTKETGVIKLTATATATTVEATDGDDGSGVGKITYQWFKDDVELKDKTEETLYISREEVSNCEYYCVATNNYGSTPKSVTSNKVRVKVVESELPEINLAGPELEDGNIDLQYSADEKYNFALAVNLTETNSEYAYYGDTKFTYTWKIGAETKGPFDLDSSKIIKYQFDRNQMITTRDCKCTVTANNHGAEIKKEFSFKYSVRVNAEKPVITTQPKNASCAKNTVEKPTTLEPLSVEIAPIADGGEISYQWYLNDVKISGATNSTLSLSTDKDAGDYLYYCAVTNTRSDVNGEKSVTTKSNEVTITIQEPGKTYAADPVWSTAIDNTEKTYIKDGSTTPATLTVEATATDNPETDNYAGTISYQWKKNGVDIPDAIGKTYTPSNSETGTFVYTVVARNTYAAATADKNYKEITSDPVTINIVNVEQPVVISNYVANYVYEKGDNFELSVSASKSDDGVLTYQWIKKVDDVSQIILGATSDTYSVEGAEQDLAGTVYWCRVTNTNDGQSVDVLSEETKIVVRAIEVPQPIITSYTHELSVYVGNVFETAPFTVVADVETSLTDFAISYKWFKDDVEIAGQTTNVLAKEEIETSTIGTNVYKCQVICSRKGESKSTSCETNLVVQDTPVPEVVAISADVEYSIGDTAENLSVTATSLQGALSYQWKVDGTEIVDATSSTYIPSTENAGTFVYTCQITNTLNGFTKQIVSDSITVSVNSACQAPTWKMVEKTIDGSKVKCMEFSCDTPGAVIYYTKDGSDPTTESEQFTSETSLIIIGTTTYKFYAVAPGFEASEIITKKVTVGASGSGSDIQGNTYGFCQVPDWWLSSSAVTYAYVTKTAAQGGGSEWIPIAYKEGSSGNNALRFYTALSCSTVEFYRFNPEQLEARGGVPTTVQSVVDGEKLIWNKTKPYAMGGANSYDYSDDMKLDM